MKFDPSDTSAMQTFQALYNIPAMDAPVVGPFNGNLSNQGERIVLEKPLVHDPSGFPLSWTVVDEVIYFDKEPWTREADGTGKVLQRISTRRPGNDPSNWQADVPTPGRSNPNTSVAAWMIY